MKIEMLTVGPLEENCYLVIDESTNRAMLIDPGDEPDRIVARCARRARRWMRVWLTHAHFDHIGGLAGVLREYPVPVYMHPLDAPLHEQAVDAALRYGIRIEAPPAPDRELREGDRVAVGSEELTVIHVPGHAPGHVAFYNDDVVFGGDCLFAGSIGTHGLRVRRSRNARCVAGRGSWSSGTISRCIPGTVARRRSARSVRRTRFCSATHGCCA